MSRISLQTSTAHLRLYSETDKFHNTDHLVNRKPQASGFCIVVRVHPPLASLESLRVLLIRPPHGISEYLYVAAPTPAHEEPSNFWLTGSQRTIAGMKLVFSTLRAYAVSFRSFFMMMTGQSGKNAASFGHNSSQMPTTLFNLACFLLASASFSTDLIQHHALQIRFYR